MRKLTEKEREEHYYTTISEFYVGALNSEIDFGNFYYRIYIIKSDNSLGIDEGTYNDNSTYIEYEGLSYIEAKKAMKDEIKNIENKEKYIFIEGEGSRLFSEIEREISYSRDGIDVEIIEFAEVRLAYTDSSEWYQDSLTLNTSEKEFLDLVKYAEKEDLSFNSDWDAQIYFNTDDFKKEFADTLEYLYETEDLEIPRWLERYL